MTDLARGIDEGRTEPTAEHAAMMADAMVRAIARMAKESGRATEAEREAATLRANYRPLYHCVTYYQDSLMVIGDAARGTDEEWMRVKGWAARHGTEWRAKTFAREA